VNGIGPVGGGASGVLVQAGHNVIQSNLVAYSTDYGIQVDTCLYNTIRRNAIHSNAGNGIETANGGNNLLPAPFVLTVTETSASGTACPGCTVEVFSDAEDEGRSYEGSTAADASGVFTFTRAGGLIGPYVTATATDRDGNTSEFSTPHKAWARICLPVILKSKL